MFLIGHYLLSLKKVSKIIVNFYLVSEMLLHIIKKEENNMNSITSSNTTSDSKDKQLPTNVIDQNISKLFYLIF